MRVRVGVLFDLDGVIIDSENLQYEAYRQVLTPLGVDISREEYGREWVGNGRGAEYAVTTYQLSVTADDLRRQRSAVYAEILRRGVALMPGAAAALDRLGSRFPLALATNSGELETRFALDHLGIAAYFGAVVTREMYEHGKPHPDAFLTAAQRLGLPPERCVVIEDAFKGVIAAARAGCKCIAVPHDFTRDNDFSAATLTLRSLDEITVGLIEGLVDTSAVREEKS